MQETNFISHQETKSERHLLSPDILKEYVDSSGNLLRKFRMPTVGGAERTQAGKKFSVDLAAELFNRELERREVFKNDNAEKRKKQEAETKQELIEGMRLAPKISPKEGHHHDGGKKNWKEAMVENYDGKKYPDGGEVRLKGYLLSTMLDCAHWSNQQSALTQIVELWADNHYQDEEKKAEKVKDILADIMPLLNTIKAYSYADAAHREGEKATNIFFQPQFEEGDLYYSQTFPGPDNSQMKEDDKTKRKHRDTGIQQALEEYGFSGAEVAGEPIVSGEASASERNEIKEKFLADLEQAQAIVNAERARRDKKLQQRLDALPVEMHSAERTVAGEEAARKQKGKIKLTGPFAASDAELNLQRLTEEYKKLAQEKWNPINVLPQTEKE